MTIERSWLTEKEQALLDRLRAKPAGLFLRGPDVRVCRVLVKKGLAKLEDHGKMREPGSGRTDGERWSAEAVRDGN